MNFTRSHNPLSDYNNYSHISYSCNTSVKPKETNNQLYSNSIPTLLLRHQQTPCYSCPPNPQHKSCSLTRIGFHEPTDHFRKLIWVLWSINPSKSSASISAPFSTSSCTTRSCLRLAASYSAVFPWLSIPYLGSIL